LNIGQRHLINSINVRETEGAIKNGHSRDTGNIGQTTYRMKTNKTPKHNTTQKTKKMSKKG
jgi:hypothetical protein